MAWSEWQDPIVHDEEKFFSEKELIDEPFYDEATGVAGDYQTQVPAGVQIDHDSWIGSTLARYLDPMSQEQEDCAKAHIQAGSGFAATLWDSTTYPSTEYPGSTMPFVCPVIVPGSRPAGTGYGAGHTLYITKEHAVPVSWLRYTYAAEYHEVGTDLLYSFKASTIRYEAHEIAMVDPRYTGLFLDIEFEQYPIGSAVAGFFGDTDSDSFDGHESSCPKLFFDDPTPFKFATRTPSPGANLDVYRMLDTTDISYGPEFTSYWHRGDHVGSASGAGEHELDNTELDELYDYYNDPDKDIAALRVGLTAPDVGEFDATVIDGGTHIREFPGTDDIEKHENAMSFARIHTGDYVYGEIPIVQYSLITVYSAFHSSRWRYKINGFPLRQSQRDDGINGGTRLPGSLTSSSSLDQRSPRIGFGNRYH